MSDDYKRVQVDKGIYQCGCHWSEQMYFGSVLVECDFHKQVTEARVAKLDNEKKGLNHDH